MEISDANVHSTAKTGDSNHSAFLADSGAYSPLESIDPGKIAACSLGSPDQYGVIAHRMLGGTAAIAAEVAGAVLFPEIVLPAIGALALVGVGKGAYEGSKIDNENRGLAITFGALYGAVSGIATGMSLGEKLADLISAPPCAPDSAFQGGPVADPLSQLPWRLDIL